VGYAKNEKPSKNLADVWEVFLPQPIGIGNTISSFETAKMTERFKPDVILMVGVAGGIPDKTNVFDVIVGERIIYYEPGKDDYTDFIPRPDHVPATRRLLQRAKRDARSTEWTKLIKPAVPNQEIYVRIEPIAAGELLCRDSRSECMKHIRK
jgi:adenosylhomocysteine nucleosidase